MSPITHIFLFVLCLGSLASASSTTKIKTTITKSSSVVPKSSTKTSATPSSSPVYTISQVAEFDNIAGTPGVSTSPVGTNSIYENLKWNGFSLVVTESPNLSGTPELIPQSAPNCIAFAQGDVETIDEGTPTITVNYEDSNIIAFALLSFYYGCTLGTEESLVGVPISCTITVTGFGSPASGSKQLATQSFDFVSNGGLSQDQTKGVFSSSFTELYSAVFTLSSAQTNLTAALIDNVSNTISSNSPVAVN